MDGYEEGCLAGTKVNLRRFVSRSIAEAVSIAHPVTASVTGLRILAYHAVGSDALGDQLGIFSISPGLFRRHMDLLATEFHDYTVPLAVGATVGVDGGVAITFDDGYRDNLLVAAPLLAERELPFTVYVSSGLLREGHPGFLTPDELRKLAEIPGATIGAHGATHVPLTNCDDRRLREELESSRAWLEDVIGREVTTMAYPYGAVDGRVRRAVDRAGYTLAECSYPAINGSGRDRLLLGRTTILGDDGMRVFRQKLRGHWDWYRFLGRDPERDQAI